MFYELILPLIQVALTAFGIYLFFAWLDYLSKKEPKDEIKPMVTIRKDYSNRVIKTVPEKTDHDLFI